MTIKLTVDLQTGRLIVEGEEGDLLGLVKSVQELVPKFEEVSIIRRAPGQPPSPYGVQPTPGAESLGLQPPSPRDLGPREFAKKFSVTTAFDRICVLAYYAIKIRGVQAFSAKEMGDWFGLCGFQKPSAMPIALSDTKRRKEYIESKGYDKWTITTIGENFVMKLLESLPQD